MQNTMVRGVEMVNWERNKKLGVGGKKWKRVKKKGGKLH